ncbi:f025bf9b-e1a0-41f7-8f17-14783295046f [Sclerotinia trifoliorum]|uniref:F025bf9b-e1a0-41f7-8f17-14783295046f n=1 Tax=Sclerotinia trifoliorum TaxID=28548 RepID=A0A8H2VZ00_9HELO|nr:f025bf9b-e1a0-41f7-8f17-14783295046f [Sclerotinia trifoliorum]
MVNVGNYYIGIYITSYPVLIVKSCRFSSTTMARFMTDTMTSIQLYILLVAASCIVLYGYDTSVHDSVQSSKKLDSLLQGILPIKQ